MIFCLGLVLKAPLQGTWHRDATVSSIYGYAWFSELDRKKCSMEALYLEKVQFIGTILSEPLHWKMKESCSESSTRAALGAESVLPGASWYPEEQSLATIAVIQWGLLCQQEEEVPAECDSKQPNQQWCSTQRLKVFSGEQFSVLFPSPFILGFMSTQIYQWDARKFFLLLLCNLSKIWRLSFL